LAYLCRGGGRGVFTFKRELKNRIEVSDEPKCKFLLTNYLPIHIFSKVSLG